MSLPAALVPCIEKSVSSSIGPSVSQVFCFIDA